MDSSLDRVTGTVYWYLIVTLLLWKRGVIPFARGSVLRLAPPLCIDAAQVDALAAVMCECIEELHGELAQRKGAATVAS